MEALEEPLERERHMTSSINTNYVGAYENNDFCTVLMLELFTKNKVKKKNRF